ncbi:doublecortin domain-containing protein 1 [Anomalospiza imberbis]|uniref:doublecortin domain-containing protein 1 n=1 Tax=Anomalospiza imberbis TaxID=187417 RepID=UPI00358FFA49
MVSLFPAPLLDRCLQNVITTLCGPVWVFEREGFSLSGAEICVQGVLLALHQRVKSAKCCKQLWHMLEKLRCLLGEGNACPGIAEPTVEELIVSLWGCGMSCVAFLPSRDAACVEIL